MGRVVKNLEIEEKIFDSHLDLYIIFGRAVMNHVRPFSVGWMARDEQTFFDMHAFRSEKEAERFFTKAVNGEESPDDQRIFDDHQKDQIYDWETSFVDPYATEMTEKEILNLVEKVSLHYSIPAPKVLFIAEDEDSYYEGDTHTIYLGSRDNLFTLHELGHAIHVKQNEMEYSRIDVPHAPRFVWIAIDLYHRYMGLSYQYLTTSAARAGILGDLNTPQICPKFD